MNNPRRWAIGLGTASLLLAGCGGTTQVVSAPESAVGDPGPRAGDGGSGGEGASTGRDSALESCLHRFDDVAIESDESWDHWRKRGAQPTWVAVSEALDARFNHTEVSGKANDIKSVVARGLDLGYVAALFDSPRDRIVVVVDPELVEMDDLEGDLQQVADRKQQTKPVQDGPIDVEVFASCAPAPELVRIRSEVRRDFKELDLSNGSGPRIDSRYVYNSRTEAGKRELERRYGGLVIAGTQDGSRDDVGSGPIRAAEAGPSRG